MIRRGFAITTLQRYIGMGINFVTLIAISRILTPQEIGTGAVGTAIALVAIAAKEFASGNYFIQRSDLTLDDVRGGFTVMLVLTVVVSGILASAAPWLASAFGDAGLCHYLWVLSATFIVEAFGLLIMVLLQRDMAFDKMAIVTITGQLLGAVSSIALATLGFSYMSGAWGWLIVAVTSATTALALRPDVSVFRPTFRSWRPMLTFGGYNGVIALLWRANEQLPYLVLGRIISMSEAGHYNRALSLAQLPQKMVLGSVFTLMFPMLSSQVRAGQSVKEPYLKAVAYITAVQWPALILLAILTEPIVRILLGSQWLGVASIVHILALAALFSPCSELNAATLISVGGIREYMLRALIGIPLAAAILCGAAGFGLKVMALSFFVTVPLNELLVLQVVRRHVAFGWGELAAILRRSAMVTAMSAAGPVAVVIATGFHLDMSVPVAMVAGALGAAGWLCGLWLTRHPLLDELGRALELVGGEGFKDKVLGRAVLLSRALAWRR